MTYVTREGSGSFLPVAMQERDYIWNLFSYHVLHTAITLSHIEIMYKCLTKEFFFLSQKSTCVLQFCYFTEEKTFKKMEFLLGMLPILCKETICRLAFLLLVAKEQVGRDIACSLLTNKQFQRIDVSKAP